MTGKSSVRLLLAAGSLSLSLFLLGCGAPPPADDGKGAGFRPVSPKKDVSQSTPTPAKGEDAKVVSDQQKAVDMEKSDGGKSPQ